MRAWFYDLRMAPQTGPFTSLSLEVAVMVDYFHNPRISPKVLPARAGQAVKPPYFIITPRETLHLESESLICRMRRSRRNTMREDTMVKTGATVNLSSR